MISDGLCNTAHAADQIYQQYCIFETTTKDDDLIDPKGPENIIYILMEYSETLKGHHVALKSKISSVKEILWEQGNHP